MNNFAVTVAWVLVAFLLSLTILGLVQNSLLGENAFFVATTAHNLVYLVTAAGFVVAAMLGTRASIRFMQVFGMAYILVSLFEFVTLSSSGGDYLLSTIHTNLLNNVSHFGLGITMAGAAWILKNSQSRMKFANRTN